MRTRGEIERKRDEAKKKAEGSTSMLAYDDHERQILDWVLFENECPECHHDCQTIGGYDDKKQKPYTYYHCPNCRWSNYENIMSRM